MKELSAEIGIKQACEKMNVPRSWLYRRQRKAASPQLATTVTEPATPTQKVKHALSDQEREQVRDCLNSPRFQDKSPRQVYATLLDEGRYLCHWRTMYRILQMYGEVKERRQQSRHPVRIKPELVATQPKQIWSWDITWLPTEVKGRFFYLYVILDIYSRYVVGWMIETKESGELAKQFIAQTCVQQRVERDQLTLHADRGAPMRSQGVAALLQDLGIKKSHSRPRTSDDNPFSESQFKTMKYRPDYPGKFEAIEAAKVWARRFFQWYNEEHYHSGLSLLTPQMVHEGQSEQVCAQRQLVLNDAFAQHPGRFKGGQPVVATEPETVWINRPLEQPDELLPTMANIV